MPRDPLEPNTSFQTWLTTPASPSSPLIRKAIMTLTEQTIARQAFYAGFAAGRNDAFAEDPDHG